MRKVIYILVLAMVVLSGCGGKTSAKLETTSSDGKTNLTIDFTRPTIADAWTADMKVKAYQWKEGSLHVAELYADDINNQTVLFDWTDTNHCTITFKLRDNTERKFQLIASPEQLQLAEL
ncbi:MAG: hypothetical protein U0V74_04025 [Chitinophagales bacterium]